MNVWAILLDLLGWLLLAVVVIFAVCICIGVCVYIVRTIKSRASKTAPITDVAVIKLSERYAELTFSESIFKNIQAGAFKRGVKYALEAKRGEHVNSV